MLKSCQLCGHATLRICLVTIGINILLKSQARQAAGRRLFPIGAAGAFGGSFVPTGRGATVWSPAGSLNQRRSRVRFYFRKFCTAWAVAPGCSRGSRWAALSNSSTRDPALRRRKLLGIERRNQPAYPTTSCEDCRVHGRLAAVGSIIRNPPKYRRKKPRSRVSSRSAATMACAPIIKSAAILMRGPPPARYRRQACAALNAASCSIGENETGSFSIAS